MKEFPEKELKAGRVGSLLFITDPKETNRLQHVAVDETRLKIPLLFGFDVVHGFRTIFPVPIGMTASWDPALVERAQAVAAAEARAVGIHWAFAPMLRHRPRPAMGPHRRGPRRGSVPGLGDRCCAGARFPGLGHRIGGPHHRWFEALCGLRRLARDVTTTR